MSAVSVRLASEADRPVLERLWLMFRHDMSEFTGTLPNPNGTFRSERLEAAFTSDDWAPYLITSADRPAGFALVRALTASTRILNSFFVVRGARRTGIGLRAVQQVVARHPGPWEVAFQDANEVAMSGINDWQAPAPSGAVDGRRGTVLDRNVELIVPAPSWVAAL